MADYFSQGAGANFGPLGGMGGGPASGTGNLGKAGYQYTGPQNVGEVAYLAGAGATQANPWGGDAGIRPYNTGIMGSAAPTWTPPAYGNTMGGGAAYGGTTSSAGPGQFGNTINPQSWNAIAANTRAGQGGVGANDLASFYAQNTLAGGGGGAGASGGWTLPGGGGGINPDAGVSQYGAGLSSPAMPVSNYGPLNIAPNPGPGSSPWDQQNNAYALLYGGPGGKPANMGPGTQFADLGQRNQQTYADTVNQSKRFANPQAGNAMAAVTSPEGSGGNPFALNYADSGATGMSQWMNSPGSGPRLNNVIQGMGGTFNYSPAAQATAAMNEITGSRQYAPTLNALNNPASTGPQMYRQVIGNFEGLGGPRTQDQMAADMAGAARAYGMTLNTNALGRGR